MKNLFAAAILAISLPLAHGAEARPKTHEEDCHDLWKAQGRMEAGEGWCHSDNDSLQEQLFQKANDLSYRLLVRRGCDDVDSEAKLEGAKDFLDYRKRHETEQEACRINDEVIEILGNFPR